MPCHAPGAMGGARCRTHKATCNTTAAWHLPHHSGTQCSQQLLLERLRKSAQDAAPSCACACTAGVMVAVIRGALRGDPAIAHALHKLCGSAAAALVCLGGGAPNGAYAGGSGGPAPSPGAGCGSAGPAHARRPPGQPAGEEGSGSGGNKAAAGRPACAPGRGGVLGGQGSIAAALMPQVPLAGTRLQPPPGRWQRAWPAAAYHPGGVDPDAYEVDPDDVFDPDEYEDGFAAAAGASRPAAAGAAAAAAAALLPLAAAVAASIGGSGGSGSDDGGQDDGTVPGEGQATPPPQRRRRHPRDQLSRGARLLLLVGPSLHRLACRLQTAVAATGKVTWQLGGEALFGLRQNLERAREEAGQGFVER